MCVYPDMWCICVCRYSGGGSHGVAGHLAGYTANSWNDQDFSWRDRLHDQDLALAGSGQSGRTLWGWTGTLNKSEGWRPKTQ